VAAGDFPENAENNFLRPDFSGPSKFTDLRGFDVLLFMNLSDQNQFRAVNYG